MHIHGGKPLFVRSVKFYMPHCVPRVLDQRNIPALGRIGDPDDIIASVLVENSMVYLFLCYGFYVTQPFPRLNPKRINPCHLTGSAQPMVSFS